MMKPPPPPGKMSAMMHSRPMAFMRGLTFPGGQQPVLRGQGVYLRYPRIADYVHWARLRGESREFLTKWEPVWAEDELTRGAFRRRIKRYQKETRLDSAYVFFVFRANDDTLMGGCTLSNVRRGVTQCCALGYWIGARFARQGFMSDAVHALIPFVFGTLGLHRIMFAVDDLQDVVTRLQAHGAELVGEVARFENIFLLCYVRSPEGVMIGLAQEIS